MESEEREVYARYTVGAPRRVGAINKTRYRPRQTRGVQVRVRRHGSRRKGGPVETVVCQPYEAQRVRAIILAAINGAIENVTRTAGGAPARAFGDSKERIF